MRIRKIAAFALVSVAILTIFVPKTYSASVDVYVVYTGKDKSLKSAIVKALPDGLAVKSYNADLLGLADFSGVQKAVSKIDRAATVIIIGDPATEYFKDTALHGNLIIVNGTKTVKKPAGALLYLLGDGHDSNKPKNTKTESIASEEALTESKAQILLLEEGAPTLPKAVAILLKKMSQKLRQRSL